MMCCVPCRPMATAPMVLQTSAPLYPLPKPLDSRAAAAFCLRRTPTHLLPLSLHSSSSKSGSGRMRDLATPPLPSASHPPLAPLRPPTPRHLRAALPLPTLARLPSRPAPLPRPYACTAATCVLPLPSPLEVEAAEDAMRLALLMPSEGSRWRHWWPLFLAAAPLPHHR